MLNFRFGRRGASIAVVGFAVALASPLLPASGAATSESSDLQYLQEIGRGASLDGTGQASMAEIESSLRAEAAKRGLTYEQVVKQVKAEAVEVEAPPGSPALRSSVDGSGDDGDGVPFPRSARAGDIFVHSSRWASVNHGHTGLYTTSGYVIEAPGPGKVSRNISIGVRTGPKGEFWLYSVGESTKRRTAAVRQALKYYQKKPYDKHFWNNRSNGSEKLNCSELVWRAFKYNTYSKIDIDRDRGLGVYPADIQRSGWLHYYGGV